MPRKILSILILSLLVAVVLLSGCVQQQAGANQTNTIAIKNFAFSPATLVVKPGTTVSWVNEDPAPHTATSEGNFDSGTLGKGQTFSRTFNEAGAFDYICTIHPSMKGRILVEE